MTTPADDPGAEGSAAAAALARLAARERALREVTQALALHLDEREVLDLAVQHAATLLDASYARVWLFDASGDLRAAAAVGHLHPGALDERLPAQSVSGLAARSNILNLPNAPSHPVWQEPEFTARTGLGSYLGAALLRAGESLGVLEVMREPGYRFSPGDEDLLRGLAGAVAVAVSNARLLRQAQEEVAERRRAEAALRESEARLAEAQRIAHLGSWEWDVLQDRITWSDELYRIYGLAPQQFQATFAAFLECIHPDDRERVQQHVEQAARSGAPFEFQHRIIRPDGTIRVLHARGEVFVDASGQPVRMAGTGQDVTEQQETELRAQQLRVEQAARAEAEAAERRLQAILDGSPAVISVKDTEGRYLTINRRYETLLGVSRAQVRGLTDYDLFPPEVADTLRENDQRALRTRAPVETEEVIRLPDGPHTYLAVKFPLLDVFGEAYAVCGIATDITSRTHLEEALRQSEREARALYRAALSIGSELDLHARLERVLDATLDLVSVSQAQVALLDPSGQELEFVATRGLAQEMTLRRQPASAGLTGQVLLQGRAVRSDDLLADPRAYNRRLAEEARLRSWLGVPLVDESGTFGALCVLSQEPGRFSEEDERKLAALAALAALAVREAHLRQRAEDAVRQRDMFLATVSHDVKNPLTALRGRVALLRRRAAQLPEADALYFDTALARIDAMAVKITWLLNDLVDLAHLQAGKPLPLDRTPTDLVALARRVIEEHQRTTERHSIRLEADEPALGGAWDAARLERVLDNLVGNAVKYSPEGGDVVLAVWRERDTSGEWAAFSVTDRGIGIPARDLPYVFDRFFRGSNVAGLAGSGIGLASAREIVEQHGGTLAVQSQEGQGSTFTARLPLGIPDQETGSPPEG